MMHYLRPGSYDDQKLCSQCQRLADNALQSSTDADLTGGLKGQVLMTFWKYHGPLALWICSTIASHGYRYQSDQSI